MAKARKKDGARTDKAAHRRQRDFDQPIVGSVTPERGSHTSNFTDGDIPGADHKHDAEGHRKIKAAVSEPRRRTTKNPE
jgi:hypothetical protein